MSETTEMAKQRLQVTVREDLVKWMDQQIETARFASRSHAIEYALTQLKESDKKPSDAVTQMEIRR
jgi:Arc/MetJ-type ribon-helix-helix transcriptional regulator